MLCRVLQPSQNPFMETLHSVIDQTKWFIFLLLLIVYGFAAAFYTLFRYDQGSDVRLLLASTEPCSDNDLLFQSPMSRWFEVMLPGKRCCLALQLLALPTEPPPPPPPGRPTNSCFSNMLGS